MKEKQLYKIGQKLGISQTEIKSVIKKNKNKILFGVVVVFAAIFLGNFYQPYHYGVVSVKDFDFFTRFF